MHKQTTGLDSSKFVVDGEKRRGHIVSEEKLLLHCHNWSRDLPESLIAAQLEVSAQSGTVR